MKPSSMISIQASLSTIRKDFSPEIKRRSLPLSHSSRRDHIWLLLKRDFMPYGMRPLIPAVLIGICFSHS